jgi:hypothetical protein
MVEGYQSYIFEVTAEILHSQSAKIKGLDPKLYDQIQGRDVAAIFNDLTGQDRRKKLTSRACTLSRKPCAPSMSGLARQSGSGERYWISRSASSNSRMTTNLAITDG